MEQYRDWENVEKSHITSADKADLEGRLQEEMPARDQLESAAQHQENRVDIKGFERSDVMTNQEVDNYLEDNLPADHLRGDRITSIQYSDQYHGDQHSTVLGTCSTNPETRVSEIEVHRQTPEGSVDRGSMEHTLTHEVGHNIYYNMGESNMSFWNQLSTHSGVDGYVSNYARTNVREDFAESYASYVRDPELLQEVNSQKYTFMKHQVFGGREYGN